jgi:hypothetical protein
MASRLVGIYPPVTLYTICQVITAGIKAGMGRMATTTRGLNGLIHIAHRTDGLAQGHEPSTMKLQIHCIQQLF